MRETELPAPRISYSSLTPLAKALCMIKPSGASHNDLPPQGNRVSNSARPRDAAPLKRVRWQFAEARIVVAGKPSEVAEAERIRDRGHRSALLSRLRQLSPRQLQPD